MNEITQTHLANLWSDDKVLQNGAFLAIIAETDQPVDWAYDVWDVMLRNLSHPDNHYRAIASQVLCNLAKSDPQNRIVADFEALLQVTRDERFVTARHCLLALWKVGAAGRLQQQLVVDGLALRFQECETEKNSTLIRYDIIQGLRKLYDVVKDEAVRNKAYALIETEQDCKYRKKYATLWRRA